MHLRIYVTGPCRLSVDGAEVRLPHRQRQALSLLVLRRGGVATVEDFEAALWAGHPPATARKAVQTHILGLRRHCGRAILSIAGGYVLATLDDGIEIDVDVVEFEAAAWKAKREPIEVEGVAADLAESALAHWHGRPYAEIEDAERVTAERARLIRLHRQVMAIRDGTTAPEASPPPRSTPV